MRGLLEHYDDLVDVSQGKVNMGCVFLLFDHFCKDLSEDYGNVWGNA